MQHDDDWADGWIAHRPTDLIFLHNNGIFRFNTPIPSEGERERAPHAGGTSKSKDDDLDDDDSESEIAAKLQLLCIQKTAKCSRNREKADLVHYPRKRVLCSSSSNAYEIGSARSAGSPSAKAAAAAGKGISRSL